MINAPQATILPGNTSTVSAHASLRHAVDEIRTDNGQELQPYHVQKSAPGESVRSDGRDLGRPGRGHGVGQRGERYETIAARLEQARVQAEKTGSDLRDLPRIRVMLPAESLAKNGVRRVGSARLVSARYRMSGRYQSAEAPELPEWRA
ncbi:MAG: hypothetical protein HQL91_09650 [Magnetococcales bacterium]|nr:hypothetical protein [Magnetococcales bacterium]